MNTVLGLLFFAAWLGGIAAVMHAMVGAKSLQSLLAFSGGYLLAIVWLHLVPELFVGIVKPLHVGSYITGGFFLQCFIERFSGGVAHSHSMNLEPSCCDVGSSFSFLCILLHALLDGTMLAHNHIQGYGCAHTRQSLLWGMMLHKFLEAFAFMSLLNGSLLSLKRKLFYLVVFALASPIGLVLSSGLGPYLGDGVGTALLAVVTGNFLYIAVTILSEANPGHTSNQWAFGFGLLGAILAACAEFLS